MAIYTLHEDENIIDKLYSRFATLPAIKDPPPEFNKLAEEIFYKIEKFYSSKPTGGILLGNKKMNQSGPYSRSVDKCKDILNSKSNKYKLSLSITHMNPKVSPKDCFEYMCNVLFSKGFKVNPEAKSFLKSIFNDKIWFYKYLTDGNIMLSSISHTYRSSYYGSTENHLAVYLEFKVVRPNEKNLRQLNFIESLQFI